MTCKCLSYNQPQPHQTDRSVLLDWGPYFPGTSSQDTTVLVDACIANEVLALWKEGIGTINSCCGHGDPSRRGIVLASHADLDRAREVMSRFSNRTPVGAWKLVWRGEER